MKQMMQMMLQRLLMTPHLSRLSPHLRLMSKLLTHYSRHLWR